MLIEVGNQQRGCYETAVEFATFLRKEHFPGLYIEPSTKKGINGYFVLNKQRWPVAELNDLLLNKLQPVLRMLAKPFGIDDVGIKGTMPLIIWDRRLVTHFKAGTLGTLPREQHRFDELKATTVVDPLWLINLPDVAAQPAPSIEQKRCGETAKETKPEDSSANKKTPAFYVPVSFDSSMFPVEQQDYVHYFLNLLHWKTIHWQADHKGFVNLKHRYLCRVIPKAIWPDIRERLDAEGIVEWDRHYCPDYKCYGFRLTEEFRKTRRVACTDPKVAKAIQRIAQERANKSLPVHRWLESKLNLLEFDLPRAVKIVNTMMPDSKSSMSPEEYRTIVTEAVHRIAEKEWFFSVDDYGRVHTPVTSLPKQLRCCLSVNNQPLAGIDLKNSQPLIAGIAARQFFRSKQAKQRLLVKKFDDRNNPYCYRELSLLGKRAEDILQRNQQGNPTPPPPSRITRYKTSQDTDSYEGYGDAPPLPSARRADIEDYIRLCEEGLFYETFKEPDENRDRCKTLLYRDVFFGRNCLQSPLKDRFKAKYPSLAEMLFALKQKNHCHSAWLLQNYEATIFVHSIARRLMQERPDLVAFTIHDSFLIRPDDADYVQQVISDEFSKLGLHPTMREEVYG